MILAARRLTAGFLAGFCAGMILTGFADDLPAAETRVFHAMGEMTGEVTTNSAILQSRLTASPGLVDGDVPGAAGIARFDIIDENGESLYRTVKKPKEDLRVLDDKAENLLRDYLLRRIHEQYDARRKAVETALRSREALKYRRTQLRKSLKTILGELPENTPLEPKVTGVIQGDGYRIEKVVYQSRPHHYVTASLYVPTEEKGPFPGVLIACGHSRIGKASIAYQNAAILMVRHGFVTLLYDAVGQGERLSYPEGPDHPGSQHKLDNVNAILVGRTVTGYQAWDGVRSLDYLLSRPEVDRDKPVGMTGNSGGGAQTMYLMALDDRIYAAAPSCHITTLERNFELGTAGDGCQSPPLTGAEGIDHGDFFTIHAPRPAIILSAEQDYKDIRFTRKTLAEARRVYELLDRPERIDMSAYDDKHSFSPPRREAAVRWMRRWLLGDPSPVSEPELKTRSPEELQVTKSGQVLREYPDALAVCDLNLRRAKELAAERKVFWESHDRTAALAEIRDVMGVSKTVRTPTVEHRGVVNRGDYRIEKLVLRRDGEVPVPALLFRPNAPARADGAVLYVDGRGKPRDAAPGGEVERLVREGNVVLSIDARGFGETADPPGKARYARGDHRTAMWALHIGKPLPGQRIEDVLAAYRYLKSLPGMNEMETRLVGIGRAGPVALHAAAFEPGFKTVTLRDSIRSWVDDVVAKPREMDSISHVAPGALRKYDLPDLAEVVGKRLTVE